MKGNYFCLFFQVQVMLKLFQITNFALRSRGVVFKTFTPQTPKTYFNIFKLQFSEEKSTSKLNESVKKNKRMRVLSSDEETEEEVVKS